MRKETKKRRKVKKRLSFLLAVCVTASCALPYAGTMTAQASGTDVADGLMGYWSFDGGTDAERLTNLAAGSAYTASVTGNGAELAEEEGIAGGAVYFSKGADSCLKLDMNEEFNAASTAFTLAAWVKYDSDAFASSKENMNLFQQSDGAVSPNGRTILYCKPSLEYGTYLSAADRIWAGGVLGEWHHVVYTSDPAGNTARLYVNGELVSEQSLTQDYYNGITDILVGAHKNLTADTAVKGYVDELRYYNKVVDADTAKALYDEFAESAVEPDEPDKPVEIAVDTTEELRDITSAMFGINHRYHKNGYGSWNTETGSIDEAFNKLAKEASFGSVRYPGGTVSNLFTWKDTIGDVGERTTTIAGNNFYSTAGETPVEPVFGVDEAMSWIYDDLNAEAVFVYGLGRGNPVDAADLVEYLNAPNDGSNPNGGTDWAAVRAANGHEEPYGVVRFEIGNEFGDTGQNYWMSGISENGRGTTALYIQGDTMTISGQQSYYQVNNKVAKKGDWRDSATYSGGEANEERYVYYLPVVEGSAAVSVDGTKWTIVDSLEGQGAANVCTFDYETGKITFGDGVNGNIPAAGSKITCNYKTEQAGFVDYYRAMKEVADEIGIEIEIYSGISDTLQADFIAKMHELGYDEYYDGVIIHPYVTASDYNASLALEKAKAASVASYKTLMETTTGDETKQVAVSEFGILSPASDYQASLGHAIYIANHMVDCVNAGAAYQNKHCLVDFTVGDNLGAWQQCVIQCHNLEDGSYEYVATPSALLFSIFNNMTGNTEVGQTVANNGIYYSDGNGTVPEINVYSTKDEEGNTYVLLINNQKEDSREVSISVDGRNLSEQEIEVWTLASEYVTDMNTLDERDKVQVVKTTVTGDGTELPYTLEAHSVTSFKIEAEKNLAVDVTAEKGGTASGSTKAAAGGSVTVTAAAEEGYVFAGWYVGDTKVSDEAEYTFTVTASVSLTARFTEKTVPAATVKITVAAETGGTASGSTEAAVGSQVTVTAVPEEGYAFAGWYEGSRKVSDSAVYTFSVTEAAYLTAKFTKKQPAEPSVPSKPSEPSIQEQTIEVGKVYDSGNYYYKVTSSTTAQVTGLKNKSVSKLVIYNTVTLGGQKYQVTSVAASAFKGNKKITSVTVKKGVQVIGTNAFAGCTKLKKVTIKSTTLTAIGTKAFYNCKKLTGMTIKSKSLKKVGKNAFKGISKKAVIKVPAAKLKAYKKLLAKKGQGSTVKIK